MAGCSKAQQFSRCSGLDQHPIVLKMSQNIGETMACINSELRGDTRWLAVQANQKYSVDI